MLMMAPTYNPHRSVDCVVFGYDVSGLKVLLVEREPSPSGIPYEPGRNMKLPGSLVYTDELLDDAAHRVLKELSGLGNVFLQQFDVLDSLDRMKNRLDKEWLEATTGLSIERVISIAYYGMINLTSDTGLQMTSNARWVDIGDTGLLPFDHANIINRALLLLRQRVRTDTVAFDLLPKKFTILQLQQILEAFNGTELDSRNFRKKIKNFDFVVPLEEYQSHVAHKPARLFRFDRKRYNQVHKDKFRLL